MVVQQILYLFPPPNLLRTTPLNDDQSALRDKEKILAAQWHLVQFK